MIGIIIILLVLLYIIHLDNVRGERYFKNSGCIYCNKETTERFTNCVQYSSCTSCKNQCQKNKGPYPWGKKCGEGCWAITWGQIQWERGQRELERIANEAARAAEAAAEAALQDLISAVEPLIEVPTKITSLSGKITGKIADLPEEIAGKIPPIINTLIPPLNDLLDVFKLFANPKDKIYKPMCLFWLDLTGMETCKAAENVTKRREAEARRAAEAAAK